MAEETGSIEAAAPNALVALGEDPRPLLGLAEVGLTDAELADYFAIPVEALAPFEILLKRARAELQARIRRAVLAAAEQHRQPEALAWLCERYLGDPSTPAAGGRAGYADAES